MSPVVGGRHREVTECEPLSLSELQLPVAPDPPAPLMSGGTSKEWHVPTVIPNTRHVPLGMGKARPRKLPSFLWSKAGSRGQETAINQRDRP